MNMKAGNKGRGLLRSNTTGLTLRLDMPLLAYYEKVAARANRVRVAHGQRGNVTVQQVILHRLRSLPAYRSHEIRG